MYPIIKLAIMKKLNISVLLPFVFAFVLIAGCRKSDIKKLRNYEQVNLVANDAKYSPKTIDPLQLNAWGLSWSAGGTAWVNSQAGHVSALYSGEGIAPRKPVNIPGPGGPATGNPTGTVNNASATDFLLGVNAPARFLFVNLDGILSGWNPAINADNAVIIKNNSATSVYTGMAIASSNGANYIYASDFKSGKIDAWDKSFNPISMPFKDPFLPKGYNPFNIQAVGEWLYVTYAKVGPDGRDLKGVGNGIVSIFRADGSFVKRFASRGLLNSPWGVTSAKKGFFMEPEDEDDFTNGGKTHRDSTMILVGNFGDGRINAYTPGGDFIGQLRSHGHTIVIEGLWAIGFAPATATAIDPNRLYFTAGPEEETDGLFGYLIKK